MTTRKLLNCMKDFCRVQKTSETILVVKNGVILGEVNDRQFAKADKKFTKWVRKNSDRLMLNL